VAQRRRSRRRRGCPCSGPAPSSTRMASSPFLVTTGVASELGASAASWRSTCSSSARRSGGAPFSLPLTTHSLEKKKEKTQRGWWLGHPSLSLPLPLKPGAAKTPGCPGFDRPGGQGGTTLLRLGPGSTHARACLPALGVRVGRIGGHPIPRTRPQRGSLGAVRIRGGGKKGEDRGEWLTDTWAQIVGG
jgi:hypothetical protein